MSPSSEPIPFETDEEIAERIRRVEACLAALARELAAAAKILDPPKDDDS
jgi:hypothetical protein